MKYRVFMATEITYYVDVEADGPEDAEAEAELEGLPQVMFLDHRYPDMGEWEVIEVEELDE